MRYWKRAASLFWAAIIACLCGVLVLVAALLVSSLIIFELTLPFFLLALVFVLASFALRNKR